jgi:hypothetical protein
MHFWKKNERKKGGVLEKPGYPPIPYGIKALS